MAGLSSRCLQVINNSASGMIRGQQMTEERVDQSESFSTVSSALIGPAPPDVSRPPIKAQNPNNQRIKIKL